jgi:hypothetical protein
MSTYETPHHESTVSDPTSATPGDRQRVPVAGGVLVFEYESIGKRLVGFETVTDWDAVADALAARGLARGHIHHLPTLDDTRRAQ